jgi:hypothetical protein
MAGAGSYAPERLNTAFSILVFPAPQWAGKKTAGQPVGFGAALCGWLIVDVFSMPYFPDIHNHYFIINGIYYPVSAYSDTPVFRTAFEFF